MKNQIGILITVYSFNKNLLKLIKSILNQTQMPKEVVIVTHKKFVLKNIKNLKLKIITCSIPNQVYQRTYGLKYLSTSTKILLQLDDRVFLYKDTILELNNFWLNANKNIIGVGLNPSNKFEDQGFINTFFKKIGFHGKIVFGFFNIGYNNFNKNKEVHWLKGGLSSWKLKYVPQIYKRKFPNWRWCVGEDLEFCLKLKKDKKFIICFKSKIKFLKRDKHSTEQSFQRGYYSILSKHRIAMLIKKQFYVPIIFYIILNLSINLISLKITKISFNFGQLKALRNIIFKKKVF